MGRTGTRVAGWLGILAVGMAGVGRIRRDGGPYTRSRLRSKGFRETVRGYLEQELIQHETEERDAILALADELLKDEEGAA